jgi:hypothetical protein
VTSDYQQLGWRTPAEARAFVVRWYGLRLLLLVAAGAGTGPDALRIAARVGELTRHLGSPS